MNHEKPEMPVETKSRGAPKGNRNALDSGVCSFLTTGRWPKGASYVTRRTRELRRAIEQAVVAIHGEVTLYDSALAQSAARHEARAMLWQRWMREKKDELTIEQLLSITKSISDATDARDRCLKNLQLDQRPDDRDSWSVLHHLNTSPSCPIASDQPTPNDESHQQSQRRTDEPASHVLEASPPSSLAESESNGKIVDCENDNENTADQNVEAQQQPEHLDPANPIDQGLWNPNTGT